MTDVRLLIVGEGKHDVGEAPYPIVGPFTAGGVITALAKRVLPEVSHDSIAVRWTDLPRYPPSPSGRLPGYTEKARVALLIARRQDQPIHALVLTADGDNDPAGRRKQLADASEKIRLDAAARPVATCVPVPAIEVFTLGAPKAIADALEVRAENIQRVLSRAGRRLEELVNKSGKPELRPKNLIEEVAQLGNRTASTDFRVAVAERTDPDELAKACPAGFAPFRNQLLALRTACNE